MLYTCPNPSQVYLPDAADSLDHSTSERQGLKSSTLDLSSDRDAIRVSPRTHCFIYSFMFQNIFYLINEDMIVSFSLHGHPLCST
jgi:hypothetical protein